MSTNRQANRLIHEKSPYLLQHAYNPVDWFPWNDEALQKAKSEDKPIFLSIGYSTCHWCHVMERESFEDEEVADILNKNFVAIKVDREERPDIDHIYMDVCQALTGSGGWPLTVIMTPDQKPFFAGTYFPKNNGMGMPGLISILENTVNAWKTKREALLESSEQILEYIKGSTSFISDDNKISEKIADIAYGRLKQHFDNEYGGFGYAPKFPSPNNCMFLLRYWKRNKENIALKMVEKTLESMYRGGIFDHIGYGFSRYSTDRMWLVPHFEKMLYDNALLAILYLEAYQATGKEQYGEVARQIFEYIKRDMTSPEGGFYSAEDADSEGEEGKFYLWTPNETEKILGTEKAQKFNRYYGIDPKSNFEGKNIPNLIRNKEAFLNIRTNPCENLRKIVFKEREKRVHPFKDDKILTSWNGLMTAALSIGARVLENKEYSDMAEKAVAFIKKRLMRSDGRLLARYRDGESAYLGYLDDYSFLIWGLIELFETTFDFEYISLALQLSQDMIKFFYDSENSGFYLYGSDSENLISRPKNFYDGATPSGNSVAAVNFFRLGRITGNSELEKISYELINAAGSMTEGYPPGYTHMLMAYLFSRSKTSEIIIVGKKESEEAKEFIKEINKRFLPNTVVIFKNSSAEKTENKDKDIQDKSISKDDNQNSGMFSFFESYKITDGKVTAYVCENYACKAPITDIQEFKNALENL